MFCKYVSIIFLRFAVLWWQKYVHFLEKKAPSFWDYKDLKWNLSLMKLWLTETKNMKILNLAFNVNKLMNNY